MWSACELVFSDLIDRVKRTSNELGTIRVEGLSNYGFARLLVEALCAPVRDVFF